MQVAIDNRTLWDALFWEPLALVKDQPPQVLISLASAALVAAEASEILPAPWYIALATGAEWAYLRGLCSTQAARSRWSAGLIGSGLALVGSYGFLAGVRKLGVQLPGEGSALVGDWAIIGAVLITLVHILPVIALGICSAMCHRVEALAIRAERQRIADEAAARTAALMARQQGAEDAERAWQEEKRKRDAAYAAELQAKRDAQQLELEALYRKTQIEEAARATRLAARHANAQPASKKMQSNAYPESINADAQVCPKCGAHIESRSAWLAARRWKQCKECKEAS